MNALLSRLHGRTDALVTEVQPTIADHAPIGTSNGRGELVLLVAAELAAAVVHQTAELLDGILWATSPEEPPIPMQYSDDPCTGEFNLLLRRGEAELLLALAEASGETALGLWHEVPFPHMLHVSGGSAGLSWLSVP